MDTKCKKKYKEKIIKQEFVETYLQADGGCTGVVVKDSSVFRLGECFDSYEDLLNRLASHSKQSMVHYWRRDSRTLQGAFMKTTRPLEPRLVYYYVKFACVFGGQKFLTRGKGQRQSMTMRTDCPAHIMVRASKSGRQLEVISVCNTHNHPITEELYKSLPQDRKLEPSVKKEVLRLLKMGTRHKCVLEYVLHVTGKTLTTKDLFNLGAGEKKPNPVNKTRRKIATTGTKARKRAKPESSDSGEEGATAAQNLPNIDVPGDGENHQPPPLYESTSDDLGNQVEILYKDRHNLDFSNKNIIEYMYPSPGVNTLHMIEGDDMTDTNIIIENVVSLSSEEIHDNQLHNNTTFQQIQDTCAMVDTVSDSMLLNKVKLKLMNIDGLINDQNKVLIQEMPDTNENTLFNNMEDVPIDQIDLNNIVVIRDNLQRDAQLVQMYELNDSETLEMERNNDQGLDDYITFQTDQDFVGFSDDSKGIIVDPMPEDCIAMLVDNDCHTPSSMNLQRDQICESCGRTGLIIENDIERLKSEKEKIEHEVKLLEMKRDMLRNEVRRESGKEWNYILESGYQGPIQYIFVDQ